MGEMEETKGYVEIEVGGGWNIPEEVHVPAQPVVARDLSGFEL